MTESRKQAEIQAVGNLEMFFNAKTANADVLHYERTVIGDFRALGRWFNENTGLIKEKFGIADLTACNTFSARDIERLKEYMSPGEQFAADQILKDMSEIKDRTGAAAVLTVLDNNKVAANTPDSIIKCFYTSAAMDGVRHGDFLRKINDSVSLPITQPGLVLEVPNPN